MGSTLVAVAEKVAVPSPFWVKRSGGQRAATETYPDRACCGGDAVYFLKNRRYQPPLPTAGGLRDLDHFVWRELGMGQRQKTAL